MSPSKPVVMLLVTLGILFLPACGGQRRRNKQVVKIGGLFNGGDANGTASSLATVFDLAVSAVTDNRFLLAKEHFAADATVATNQAGETLVMHNRVCADLRWSNLTAFFGPSSAAGAAHLAAVAKSLQVPAFETHWNDERGRPDTKPPEVKDLLSSFFGWWAGRFQPAEFSFSLFPSPREYSRAVSDLVRSLGWRRFVVLYEDDAALASRLTGVLALQGHFREVDKRRPVVREEDDDDEDDGAPHAAVVSFRLPTETDAARFLFKEIRRARGLLQYFVVDCAADSVESVLTIMREMNLTSEYSAVIFTSPDFHLANFTRLPLSSLDCNVTGFRMVDPGSAEAVVYLKDWQDRTGIHLTTPEGENLTTIENHPLALRNAVMFDSVRFYATALDFVSRQEEGIMLDRLSCGQRRGERRMPGGRWRFGEKMADILRDPKTTEFRGVSGAVSLDVHGTRSDFSLDVLDRGGARDGQLVLSGRWESRNGGLNYSRLHPRLDDDLHTLELVRASLANKTLQVATLVKPPFVMKRPEFLNATAEDLRRMDFEEVHHGYAMDLVKQLKKQLGFKTAWHIVYDGSSGKQDDLGHWNGAMKELIDKDADLAVMDMSITERRKMYVDFTHPFMYIGIGLLYKVEAGSPPNLWSFLDVFHVDVWLYLLAAYILSSLLFFLVGRLAPGEWRNPHPCDEEPEELENVLTLPNCFWHQLGMLFQQGSDIAPFSVSGRMFFTAWSFLILIVMQSYTGALSAYLTTEGLKTTIKSAEELAGQNEIEYGMYGEGSTRDFFKHSTVPYIKKLYKWMTEKENNATVFMGSADGKKKVESEKFAYFMESAMIEYYAKRNCSLRMVGGLLDDKGYAIALPKGSRYTKIFTVEVTRLIESGFLQKLHETWWKAPEGSVDCEKVKPSETDEMRLGLANLGGIFVLLIPGVAISIIVAFVEFLLEKNNRRSVKSHGWSHVCSEMGEALLLATNPAASSYKVVSTTSPAAGLAGAAAAAAVMPAAAETIEERALEAEEGMHTARSPSISIAAPSSSATLSPPPFHWPTAPSMQFNKPRIVVQPSEDDETNVEDPNRSVSVVRDKPFYTLLKVKGKPASDRRGSRPNVTYVIFDSVDKSTDQEDGGPSPGGNSRSRRRRRKLGQSRRLSL